jgi:hypothetical protein
MREVLRRSLFDELAKIKEAGVIGNLRQAVRAPGVKDHLTELGGLGVLAVPGMDTLQAHARARMAGDKTPEGAEKRRLLGEGAHAALDVGGLGMLMGPEFKHLRHP